MRDETDLVPIHEADLQRKVGSMKITVIKVFLGVITIAFVALPAGAEELTVTSILTAQQAGAPADGIIAMVDNPANTVAMTAGEIVTLKEAGVPADVITAIWAKIPAPAAGPLQPDDSRLVDLVRLVNSGMSEAIIDQQLQQEGQTYNLSVNDLLYLKQNGVEESMIAALMTTGAEAPDMPELAPSELVFDNLVQLRWGFWKKNREGHLTLSGDTFSWKNDDGSGGDFQFQTTGLEKVWFTCEARSSGDFCHQINFKIVKGETYRFQDRRRDSGSNAAVVEIMDALRKYYPRLNFSTPSVGD